MSAVAGPLNRSCNFMWVTTLTRSLSPVPLTLNTSCKTTKQSHPIWNLQKVGKDAAAAAAAATFFIVFLFFIVSWSKLLSLSFFLHLFLISVCKVHLSLSGISMATPPAVQTTLCVGMAGAGKVLFFCFYPSFLIFKYSSSCDRFWVSPPPTSPAACVSVLDLPSTGTAGSSPPRCPRCRRSAGHSGEDTGYWVADRTRGSRTGQRWGCRSRTPSCGTSPDQPEGDVAECCSQDHTNQARLRHNQDWSASRPKPR